MLFRLVVFRKTSHHNLKKPMLINTKFETLKATKYLPRTIRFQMTSDNDHEKIISISIEGKSRTRYY